MIPLRVKWHFYSSCNFSRRRFTNLNAHYFLWVCPLSSLICVCKCFTCAEKKRDKKQHSISIFFSQIGKITRRISGICSVWFGVESVGNSSRNLWKYAAGQSCESTFNHFDFLCYHPVVLFMTLCNRQLVLVVWLLFSHEFISHTTSNAKSASIDRNGRGEKIYFAKRFVKIVMSSVDSTCGWLLGKMTTMSSILLIDRPRREWRFSIL